MGIVWPLRYPIIHNLIMSYKWTSFGDGLLALNGASYFASNSLTCLNPWVVRQVSL